MAELCGKVEGRESRRVDLSAIRGVLGRNLGHFCRRDGAHGLVERVVLWGRTVSAGQTKRLILDRAWEIGGVRPPRDRLVVPAAWGE